MSLNSFNRNYGMSGVAREWWGGNNGFVTIVIDLPTDVEIGTTKVVSDGSDAQADAYQTALSNAQYNLFMVTQLLQQRAVLVTTSLLALDAEVVIPEDFKNANPNVVAFGTSGTDVKGGANSVALTFICERQDVFNKQEVRPGSACPAPVDPTVDLAKSIAQAKVFRTKTFVSQGTDGVGDAGASTAVAIKVRAALPVQL
ncbi:hypothetical protein N0S44_000114 [Escherichia coli]|uniref:hypothetical protein n=1 Tax=Escherichia coli TaxID=562 RepID=UPI002200A66C|nr:hypothetical protein [Escherichia coli]EJR1978964.1 hypothetical protein [Escherichia coli]UTS53933.1 hypothetical protein UES1_566 [Escherichia phage UE-S1]